VNQQFLATNVILTIYNLVSYRTLRQQSKLYENTWHTLRIRTFYFAQDGVHYSC